MMYSVLKTRNLYQKRGILQGRESGVFARSPWVAGATAKRDPGTPPPWRSFSVHLPNRTLDFTTSGSDELACVWAIGLSTLIAVRRSPNQVRLWSL